VNVREAHARVLATQRLRTAFWRIGLYVNRTIGLLNRTK